MRDDGFGASIFAITGPVCSGIQNYHFRIGIAGARIKAIRSLVRESRGQQRILLRELGRNINRISVFLESGAADDQIDKVIADLEVECFETASKSGFDFNSLKRGGLKQAAAMDLPQFKSYSGLSTEDLFDKLYSWIHRLKIIVADYPGHARLRKNVRLINIWKLMLFLVKHIKS